MQIWPGHPFTLQGPGSQHGDLRDESDDKLGLRGWNVPTDNAYIVAVPPMSTTYPFTDVDAMRQRVVRD